jgi:hypothetical protein
VYKFGLILLLVRLFVMISEQNYHGCQIYSDRSFSIARPILKLHSIFSYFYWGSWLAMLELLTVSGVEAVTYCYLRTKGCRPLKVIFNRILFKFCSLVLARLLNSLTHNYAMLWERTNCIRNIVFKAFTWITSSHSKLLSDTFKKGFYNQVIRFRLKWRVKWVYWWYVNVSWKRW